METYTGTTVNGTPPPPLRAALAGPGPRKARTKPEQNVSQNVSNALFIPRCCCLPSVLPNNKRAKQARVPGSRPLDRAAPVVPARPPRVPARKSVDENASV